MEKSELRQVKSIIREIRQLQRDLEIAELKVEARQTTDSVVGSSPSFPYIQHVITVSGIDMQDYTRKAKRLREQLQRRLDDLMDIVAEAEEYIASVPDSDTRQILQCKFINGLTWEQIEEETGINYRTAQRKFRNWKYCR